VGQLIKLASMLGLLLSLFTTKALAADCPTYLDQSFKKLHSQETLNLCTAYAGKPLLIVNTASFCGFTPQFAGLEQLHKQYKDKGLVVLGFASDDFFQEADSDKEIANVCYLNYGVTFPMFSPIHVRGNDANPLFKALAEQSSSPKWNFSKYLVDKDGKVVKYFNSLTKPDSDELKQAIEGLLQH
jgi:glutathione peroxidase